MLSPAFVLCSLFYVLTASSLAIDEATSTATVSGAKTSVREKVRQTIENLIKKPKAAIGTLNQIADTSLEVKTKNGKIEMIATNASTTYARITKNKKADIKFEELVIGDYTVALGAKNSNGIVEAKRILTYDKEPILTTRAVFGLVEENNKGKISIKHPKNGKAWTIQTSKKTNLTGKGFDGSAKLNIKDIEAGDRIVVIGTPDGKLDSTINAARIHILAGKALGLQKSLTVKVSPTPKPSTSPKPSPTPQN